MIKLEDLAFKLNTYEDAEGTRFSAELSPDAETLQVVCESDPDSSIVVIVSEEQIISISPLFDRDDIDADLLAKLDHTLLGLNPVIPLSSIGLQENVYILFGAMSVNTSIENIAHELAVQADNVTDVLASLENYFEHVE